MKKNNNAPPTILSRDCIDKIIQECERLMAIPIEDVNYTEPYKEVISALTKIKNQTFRKGSSIVISTLEG